MTNRRFAILLGLTYLLTLLCPSVPASVHARFSPINVSDDKLESSTISQVFTVPSLIFCAAVAMQTSWSYIMCYLDHQCTLYDIKVSKLHAITDDKEPFNCWADLETLPLCPPGLFSEVEGLGCVHVGDGNERELSEAKAYCASLDSQLITPNNFTALREHILSLPDPSGSYWVGIKNGFWLDGKPLTSEEERPNDSGDYGNRVCGYLNHNVDYHIYTNFCDRSRSVVCEFPITD